MYQQALIPGRLHNAPVRGHDILSELVRTQHEKARQILTDNKYIMDALAEYLYKKETITGDEFMLIIREQTRQRQLDVRKAIEIPPAEA